MPIRNDALGDRRFWAALYAGSFGQIADPPDEADVCRLLGVGEEDVLDWYDDFTGSYPGILDDSDGHSDDPATVEVALANGVELRVERHPGDDYWFLRGPDNGEAMLANVGPHWALPGLRWQEAAAMAAAAPKDGWVAMLLLLPVVWLTAGDDGQAARLAAESAWAASKLLPHPSSAAALSDLWANAVDTRNYTWRRSNDGWVCDAEWSTRAEGRPTNESGLLNRLIKAASGAA